jgi:hypothetical protein
MATKIIDDGGPVYPSAQPHCPDGSWNQTYEPGVTLRDHFAGQAMPAIISGWIESIPAPGETWDGMIARLAYEVADAMIRARGER